MSTHPTTAAPQPMPTQATPTQHTLVDCHTMADVRRGVDALDDLLVPLLVQRASYMTQAARIKQDASQVRDEDRIQTIVDRVRARTAAEGGPPDVMEAIYRSLMEVCIAYEHREFARLRGDAHTATNGGAL
jgi:isochorismate pyruvate lyase